MMDLWNNGKMEHWLYINRNGWKWLEMTKMARIARMNKMSGNDWNGWK